MADLSRRLLLGTPLLLAAGPASHPYDFRFPAIEGGEIDLGAWRGKPMLVVNTASFCGFAPQFAALQKLHETYAPRGLLLLGVPSNDFNQEAADNAAVKAFCDAEFGVDFPMAAISHVKGPEAHPFFAWAGEPRWNFFKYLVGRDGRLLQTYPSRVEPGSPELLRAVEAALG
ncbi:glutathione peroxidase [Pseudoroseomonas ludipueritiae]|uniref:Glutathione peroxidase n=1 Tax=Pseudoroseomonas ludipueritiae TaxID=198093 RepID=A0ABR7R1B1_9PROT|nr:glutathione peroxidase [Pseudoroseomonas ludipueritiae]MBC9175410.1 glutathione peroxidase [Pseudoroseomonas ludipueritiae]MCG7362275.1 glutathione peroxidase [Roseomonas sp. ACRSG]